MTIRETLDILLDNKWSVEEISWKNGLFVLSEKEKFCIFQTQLNASDCSLIENIKINYEEVVNFVHQSDSDVKKYFNNNILNLSNFSNFEKFYDKRIKI